MEKSKSLALVFQALSDKTRVELITELIYKEQTIGDLANLTGISPSRASHQVSKLLEVGLVGKRVVPPFTYVRLRKKNLDEVFRFLQDLTN